MCLIFDHDQIIDLQLFVFRFNNTNLEKITIGVLPVTKNMFQK